MRVIWLALLSIGCATGPTATLASGTLEEHVAARAIVEPRDGVARVSAEWTARVIALHADVGDRVEAGTVLAELDRNDLELDECIAPIAGIVVARHASVGDDVSRADGPLFEIADPSALQLRIEIEDADAARVPSAASVELLAGDGTIATTVIARVAPRMEPRTIDPDGERVRTAFAAIDASPDLPLGRVLDVRIALAPREVAVLAPRSAVVLRDGHPVVRTAGGDTREVEIGSVDDTHVEITRGVSAGTVLRLEP